MRPHLLHVLLSVVTGTCFGSSKGVSVHFHLHGSGACSSAPSSCFASAAMSTLSSENMQIMAAMVAMALQQAGVGSLGGGGAGQSGGGQGLDNRAPIDTNAIRIRGSDGSPSVLSRVPCVLRTQECWSS